MRRSLAILAAGLLFGLLVFYLTYLWQTRAARHAMNSPLPELTWVRSEFGLTDQEFERVSRIHAEYLPDCKEMCRRIDEQNSRLRELVLNAEELTPEVNDALREAVELRLECQTAMLNHFYEMSKAMHPEKGRHYLAAMQELTILGDTSHREQ